MVKITQRAYDYVELYVLPIRDRFYRFYILVSKDDIVAWMPDSEQQHVNLGYNGNDCPAKLGEVSQIDVARMIGQMLFFQTKIQLSLEVIISKHSGLIGAVQQDLKTYYSQLTKQVTTIN